MPITDRVDVAQITDRERPSQREERAINIEDIDVDIKNKTQPIFIRRVSDLEPVLGSEISNITPFAESEVNNEVQVHIQAFLNDVYDTAIPLDLEIWQKKAEVKKIMKKSRDMSEERRVSVDELND